MIDGLMLSGKLGIGKTLVFGRMLGVGEESLNHVFARMFLNSEQKHEVVGDLGAWENEIWKWKFSWRRPWFDWERDRVIEFERLLEGVECHDPLLGHDRRTNYNFFSLVSLSYTT